jgi:hypothetical protein
MRFSLHRSLLLVAAVAVAACTGTIGGDGDEPGTANQALCETPQPGANPMRRLTAYEYANTIEALFGASIDPGTDFPDTIISEGFRSYADANIVSGSAADGIARAAEYVSSQVDVATLLGCSASEASCVPAFIDEFGKRAYRRPLSDEERSILQSAYDQALLDSFTETEAVGMVLEIILQSPQFLYRSELSNIEAVAVDGPVRLDAWELASRLSFLFWDATPDAELMALAESGELRDPAVIEQQARRLLTDPRSREPVARFVEDWLELYRLDGMSKDTTTYPQWTPELQASLEAETTAFVGHVMWEMDGKLETLLSTSTAVINGPLAGVYGVSGPSGVDDWQATSLDAEQRSGLLTTAAFLTAHANETTTNPVQRGAFVRAKLLCQVLHVPEDIMIDPISPDPNLPKKEKLAEHETPECATCHSLMDPVGFGFEHYDALGGWRETEGNNIPVDATGELAEAGEVSGPFYGAVELSEKLSRSEMVQACMVVQTFRFAAGREETDTDACSIQQLESVFAGSEGNLIELLIALTQTDAFRYRIVPQLEDSP